MAVPKYDEMTLPLLKLLGDGREHHQRELCGRIADQFELSDEDRASVLPKVKATYLRHRMGWAGFHLRKAELADSPSAGVLRITPTGKGFLETNPTQKLNRAELSKFEPFRGYIANLRKPASAAEVQPSDGESDESTPDERIDRAYHELEASLASDLQAQMAKMDPFRFEQLVVDLLFAMGYGGSREEAARVTKKSGDEGIDGVINEDRLGLDVIYVQAKRWKSNVGRIEIQSFVGALAGQQAHKGIFITTSDFVQNAMEYARSVPQKVILIDGTRLAELMIEHDVGVATSRTIALKRIDTDYFSEG